MHRLSMMALALATLAGCKGGGGKSADDSDNTTTTTPGTDDTSTSKPGDACVAPGSSKCDNPASIVRGYVARDFDSTMPNWRGNLWVFLVHNWDKEGELGGLIKTSVEYKDVNLSKGDPFPFEIDMCDGAFGAMWSEDACGYNLELLLDLDGNATPEASLPGDNEPAIKIDDIELSCQGDSPCLDTILLSCKRGAPCFQWAPGEVKDCDCATTTCNSDYSRCG